MIRKYKTSNLFHNKVNNFFLLVYCILHGLPRSTVFVFYIENHQIASVNHISISRLVCSFGIYLFIRVVHIDFVIVRYTFIISEILWLVNGSENVSPLCCESMTALGWIHTNSYYNQMVLALHFQKHQFLLKKFHHNVRKE